LGILDPKSSLPIGDWDPHLIMVLGHTSVPAKWDLIPSNGFSRVHKCEKHTDRQTNGPHADIAVTIGRGLLIKATDSLLPEPALIPPQCHWWHLEHVCPKLLMWA